MESFSAFVDDELAEREFVEDSNILYNIQPVSSQVGNKVWNAKKKEIMQLWQNLLPDIPVYMEPLTKKISTGKRNSSYGEDGIRITGSWKFVSSVLSRLKSILAFENDQYKLRLVLRGVASEKTSRHDRQNFVFYVNLESRSKKS